MGDIFLINLSFALAYSLKFGDLAIFRQPAYLVLFFYYNVVWLAVAFTLRIYNISRVARYTGIALDLLKLLFFHVSLMTAFIVAIKGYDYSRQHLVVTYLLVSASVVAWRLGCVKLFRMFRIAGRNSRRVVIVGMSEIANQLKKFFNINPQYGYQFMGFFDDRAAGGEDLKGKVADVKEYALSNKVDEIYCTMTEVNNRQVNELLDFAEKNHIHVKVVPDFREINYRKIEIDFYDDFPVLTFREIPLDDMLNQAVKRSFDVLFSLLVIVFVYPWLLPIIALSIKSTPGDPFSSGSSGRAATIRTSGASSSAACTSTMIPTLSRLPATTTALPASAGSPQDQPGRDAPVLQRAAGPHVSGWAPAPPHQTGRELPHDH
jgi:hypothetical protein